MYTDGKENEALGFFSLGNSARTTSFLSNGSMLKSEKSCGSESSINYFHGLFCYLRGMRNHQGIALYQAAYLQKPGLHFNKPCSQELLLWTVAGTKILTPAYKKVPKISTREMKCQVGMQRELVFHYQHKASREECIGRPAWGSSCFLCPWKYRAFLQVSANQQPPDSFIYAAGKLAVSKEFNSTPLKNS